VIADSKEQTAHQGATLCRVKCTNMTIGSAQSVVREVADDDLDLVHAAKNGDVAAFEQLVSRYDRKLLRIAQSITHNREDSQDAVQEAFLKAYQNLSAFREDSKFSTWLFRITVNQSLIKLRRQRASREASLDEDFRAAGDVLPKEVTDWAPNPEQLFWASELRDLLIKCLRDSRSAQCESDGSESTAIASSAATSRGPEQVLQQAKGICESRVKLLRTPDATDATFS
jgi:RNA polymerase sigma factor (sigma-70 family)